MSSPAATASHQTVLPPHKPFAALRGLSAAVTTHLPGSTFKKGNRETRFTELDFQIAQPVLQLTNHTPPVPAGKNGFFYEPTILADVQEGVRIVDEEQFGPVMPLIKYTDVDDALVRDIYMTKACSYDLDVFFLMAFGCWCVLEWPRW